VAPDGGDQVAKEKIFQSADVGDIDERQKFVQEWEKRAKGAAPGARRWNSVSRSLVEEEGGRPAQFRGGERKFTQGVPSRYLSHSNNTPLDDCQYF